MTQSRLTRPLPRLHRVIVRPLLRLRQGYCGTLLNHCRDFTVTQSGPHLNPIQSCETRSSHQGTWLGHYCNLKFNMIEYIYFDFPYAPNTKKYFMPKQSKYLISPLTKPSFSFPFYLESKKTHNYLSLHYFVLK
jgi:hypothetical protein